ALPCCLLCRWRRTALRAGLGAALTGLLRLALLLLRATLLSLRLGSLALLGALTLLGALPLLGPLTLLGALTSLGPLTLLLLAGFLPTPRLRITGLRLLPALVAVAAGLGPLPSGFLGRAAHRLTRRLRMRTRLGHSSRTLLSALLTEPLLEPLHLLGQTLRAPRDFLGPSIAALCITLAALQFLGKLALLLGEVLRLVAQRFHGAL